MSATVVHIEPALIVLARRRGLDGKDLTDWWCSLIRKLDRIDGPESPNGIFAAGDYFNYFTARFPRFSGSENGSL